MTKMQVPVEVYVGRMDGTWYTKHTEVVCTTSIIQPAAIEAKAIEQVKEALYRDKLEAAFVGVYHLSLDDAKEIG